MNTKSYILAGIIAAITTNAMATGENIIASKSYTDTKQTKIPLGSLEIDTGKTIWNVPHSLVAYPTTNIGEIGEYGIMDEDFVDFFGTNAYNNLNISDMTNELVANMIPTSDVVGKLVGNELSKKQNMIPKSGFSHAGSSNQYVASHDSHPNWFDVAGTGLVTRTATDGQIGERKIFEASDVSGYHAAALTQTEKDIQDISIPTVGAMMNAISSGATAALPTGTTGTVVTYNGATNGVQQFTETAIASSATHNPSTGALTNGSDIANVTLVETEIATRQAKKVCAGWPDGTTTYDAQHTDANCWLWTFPD